MFLLLEARDAVDVVANVGLGRHQHAGHQGEQEADLAQEEHQRAHTGFALSVTTQKSVSSRGVVLLKEA